MPPAMPQHQLRRRLSGKQVPPPAWQLGPQARAGGVEAVAVAAEALAADGLTPLADGARRRHVHYTHARTHRPTDVQPEQLTRAEFWEHLVRCYQEAYPSAETSTGSILAFGVVVKELHRGAVRSADRAEHHHAATFSVKAHVWKRIHQISAERYHIQLNAVAHGAYATMYQYL